WATGRSKVKNEITGDLQRQLRAVIFFDQRERKVHSSGDAGGCVNIFIPNKYRVWIDISMRRMLDQSLTPIPVSGGAPSVEQSSSREQHRACANRTKPPSASGNLSQPAHRLRVDFVLLNRVATSHEQRVDLAANLPKRFMRREFQSAVRI